jgi:hypothetical protein
MYERELMAGTGIPRRENPLHGVRMVLTVICALSWFVLILVDLSMWHSPGGAASKVEGAYLAPGVRWRAALDLAVVGLAACAAAGAVSWAGRRSAVHVFLTMLVLTVVSWMLLLIPADTGAHSEDSFMFECSEARAIVAWQGEFAQSYEGGWSWIDFGRVFYATAKSGETKRVVC